MVRLLLFLSVLLVSSEVFASSWKDSFFTDDSAYYLKLKKNGFTQRFRVNKNTCDQIANAQVVFKKNSNTISQSFNKLPLRQLVRNWPDLYGINEANYCWFEIEVTGIDLNRPMDNKYVVKIIGNNSGTYFTGLNDSIIPNRRLIHYLDEATKWIDLGALGPSKVEGGGVFFKFWEPVADEVHLVFKANEAPIKLIPDAHKGNDSRSYVIYLPQVPGKEYNYRLVKGGSYEVQEVSNFGDVSAAKVDPMSKAITYSGKGGKINGYLNLWSMLAEERRYDWKYDNFLSSMSLAERDNWIMYQIWPLTFNPKKDQKGKYLPGTFQGILEKLDYIDNLGVTAVELMPINESRFHASWGYAADSILLLEKNYGQPYDLKELVDNLHGRKVRVLLDIVINHINNTLIRDPLTKTVTETKYYKGNTGWGPIPRFESVMVRKWIMDSLKILMRDYHVDGFRFDMVKYIYEGNPVGYRFLQEMNILMKAVNPSFYSSAEQLPDNVWATRPVEENGLGFDSQWNDKFKNFFEHGLNLYRVYDRTVNLDLLKAPILGYSNHGVYGSEYKFGHPKRTVNYLGSHDFVGNKNPILRVVSDYEGYEWVGNNNFYRVRPLEEKTNTFHIFRRIHNGFTHAVGRMSYGTLFTKPGGILFFQGEELASDINLQNEWSYVNAREGNSIPSNNVDLHRYISSHRMPWEYLNPSGEGDLRFLTQYELDLFKGYHQFFKDMIKFRADHPEFNEVDAKNVRISYEDSIFTYEVQTGLSDFFVVLNYGDQRKGAWVTFPAGTNFWWEEIFNSSEKKYSGGDNVYTNIISSLGGRSNFLRLEGSSFVVFKKDKDGKIKRPLYLMGNINNWSASEDFKVDNGSDGGEVYAVTFKVKSAGEYEFKLATEDWEIDLGSVETREKLERIKRVKTNTSGSVGYFRGLPNFKVKLLQGTYRFFFNINSFRYNFTKL